MCGIAGKIVRSGRVTESSLRCMGYAIAHRGPDDSGTYISPDGMVGLVHRRLAIIDLSPLGHQPMEWRSWYTIVFNGEIYNHNDKRAELEAKGYVFQSKSDTEVILALYDRYGVDCLAHLRGMFAFAIYDRRKKIVFCARDRVGKKPLKYYHDKKIFLFASELKAILTQGEYSRKVDYSALGHFLTLGYAPCPSTGFMGIKKLPPAHYLIFDQNNHSVSVKRYWQLDYEPKLKQSTDDWGEQLRDKLAEAVRIRLMSDVPLGAFLSGGLDSSAVVAYMSQFSPVPVQTFSIGFTHDTMNELPQARLVSDYFGTKHTEFVVEPNAIDLLPKLVSHYEEPFADSSALPSYLVSQMARKHVTVALNGDGGDENFGGYDRYVVQKFGLAYERLGWANRYLMSPLVSLTRGSTKLGLERARRFVDTLDLGYERRFAAYTPFLTERQKQELMVGKLKQAHRHSTYDLMQPFFHNLKATDRLDQTLGADLQTYLPDDLLTKIDIATMAVSLEGRSPFLDHELLELTAKIPSSLKIHGRTKKYIFKQAMTNVLPPEIMNLPKRGFSVPLNDWLKGSLKDYVKDILLSQSARKRNLFDASVVERMIDDHILGRGHYAHHLWALLTLEWWFCIYFDESVL